MTQLDFGYIFCLNFINSEADHKVGYNLFFLLGFADNLDSLINIKQNLLHTLKAVELFPCL